MELSPYLENLGRDLAAAAATGGPEITRAADLLAGALDASARLCLLEALSDAAAEITTKLDSGSVEVRLRGREADLVVTPVTPAEHPADGPAAAPVTGDGGGDLARITLRLPEWLKQQVERSAASTGVSVNSWLVDAIGASVKAGPSPKAFPLKPPLPGKPGRRITGFAQA
jgi:HicB-like protein involved in pilus formation